MLAPAVAAGKGVKGKRNAATAFAFASASIVVARPPTGGLALLQLTGEIFADFCYIKSMIFLVCLAALILPLILIPVEKIAPYPYVIEEIAKAILILQILKSSRPKNQLMFTLVVAFIFAFSENIFYATNFIVNSIFYNFWQRSLLTTSLHLLTAVIILLPSQRKLKLIVPATILAMVIHYFYNQLVLLVF